MGDHCFSSITTPSENSHSAQHQHTGGALSPKPKTLPLHSAQNPAQNFVPNGNAEAGNGANNGIPAQNPAKNSAQNGNAEAGNGARKGKTTQNRLARKPKENSAPNGNAQTGNGAKTIETNPPSKTFTDSRKRGQIRVTQINLNKSIDAWDDIISSKLTQSEVILVQEPPLIGKQKRMISRNGYMAVYDKTATRPRAGIMIHKNISKHVFLLNSLTDGDTVTILLKLGNKASILSSIYMGRGMECPPPKFKEIVDYAKTNNHALVLGSDVNAHSTAWGSVRFDPEGTARGEALLDKIIQEDLHISNVNNAITFDNGRWENVIDLTITNNSAVDSIREWQTNKGVCRSDHIPITFVLGDMDGRDIRTFQNIKKTNWGQYREIAISEMEKSKTLNSEINTIEELEEATKTITEIMIKAYQKSTPKTYVSSQIKDPPWLTEEVEKARLEMLEKLEIAQDSKKQQDWALARAARNSHSKIRVYSKRKCWKTWTEELDAFSDAQKISHVIKTSDSYKLNCVYDKNGNITSSPKETLLAMADVHFGDHNITRPSTQDYDKIGRGKWSNETTFSTTRIIKALREFRPLTAAGPDSIRPIMMQKIADTFAKYFAKIVTASYELGRTPTLWQEAEAIYLPKPGKGDYRQPKSFRTITLASNLQKLAERLVLWHIEADQKVHKKLNKSQYGFRRGVSTETALHKVVRKIEKTLMNQGIALGTFLDIEGAFDNVAFKAIERALHAKLRDKRTVDWIMFTITNRKVTTKLLGESLTIMVTRGCPQGGILSPFLWNLVMDDLLNHSKNKIPGDLQGFADDLSLLVTTTLPPSSAGPSVDILPLRDATQKSLTAINKWCKSVGLKLSALKSHIVIFTHRHNVKINDPIKIGGNPINTVSSTKFLGLTLDSKLNWNEHIVKQIKKCKNILMQCRRVVGPTWGLNPKTASWIYTTIVRPALSYGAMVWANAMLTKTNQDNMIQLQRLALKMVTGALPSTPSAALDKITNTTPITEHLRFCAVKTAYTLMATGQWEGPVKSELKNPKKFTSHANTVNKTLRSLPPEWTHDLTTPELSLDRDFLTEIPDRGSYREVENEYTTVIYTDGSKIDGNAGAGLTIWKDGEETTQKSFNLGQHISVPASEMFAIQQASQTLLNSGTANERILINCDSQGTIKSLDTTTSRSKTTLRTISNLNTLSIWNNVTVRWIPAHQGHHGNELADALAKKGAQNTSEETLIPIPKAAAYAALRNKIKTGNRKISNHMDMIWADRFGKSLKNMTRSNLRAATHLLTGHGNLNYHMKKLKKVKTTACNLCGLEDETVKHVLTECPLLWKLRQEVFDKLCVTMDDIKNHLPFPKTVTFYRRAEKILHPEDPPSSR